MIVPNNIYCGDCYELIKEIPDKSIDLVYIDIPYDFKTKPNKERWLEKYQRLWVLKEKEKDPVKAERLRISAAAEMQRAEFSHISQGIDWSILDELCRVMKYIYIYMAKQGTIALCARLFQQEKLYL